LGSLSKAPIETLHYLINIIYLSYKKFIELFTLIGSKHIELYMIDYYWKIVLAFEKRLAQRVRFID